MLVGVALILRLDTVVTTDVFRTRVKSSTKGI